MSAAPPPIMTILLLGGMGLTTLFLLWMILRTLTGRSHRSHQPAAEHSPTPHPRSVLAPMLLFVSLLVAGVVMVGVLTLAPYQMVQEDSPMTAMHDPAPVALVDTSTEEVGSAATEQASNETDSDSVQPPLWTKNKETIIATGEVPRVLFVETSGLYSTQEEAFAEAKQNAISKFRSRLSETYRKLAVQPLPERIFQDASMKQVFIEKRMHSFGTYDEPMYRVYLQYMDSAETREPVIEAWKGTFASNRAMQYGIGFGVLTALLGVVSAGLRAVSAVKGSRGRAVMTALAFAGLGLVGLMFVA